MDSTTLAKVLEDAGVAHRLIDVGSSTKTAREAAAALGVPEKHVVKSLVCLADDAPVLALVSGGQTLSLDKLRLAMDASSVQLARGRGVRDATGYPIGAVAPIGHPVPLPTIGDASIRALDVAYFGGGSHRHMLRLAPIDLERLVPVRWTDLALDEEISAATATRSDVRPDTFSHP